MFATERSEGEKKARLRELKNLQKSWTYRTTVPRLSHTRGGREEAWTILPLSDGSVWLVWDFLSKPEFQNHCHQRKRKWKKICSVGVLFRGGEQGAGVNFLKQLYLSESRGCEAHSPGQHPHTLFSNNSRVIEMLESSPTPQPVVCN